MRKLLSPIILAGLFLSGCQKELSIENGGGILTPTPSPTDSIYLESIVEVQNDNAGTLDSTIISFFYDNLKRVGAISKKYYRNGALSDSTLRTYFYNSTDTLPYKYYNTGSGPYVIYTDTVTGFFTYNVQGYVTRDSSNFKTKNAGSPLSFAVGKRIVNRQLNTGLMIADRVTTSQALPGGAISNYHTLDSAWLDVNNNILRDADYDLLSFVRPPLQSKTTYTYDNKPDPFTALNIYKVLYDSRYGDFEIIASPNNYTSYTFEDYFGGPPPAVNVVNYNNTYNTNGKLLKSILTVPGTSFTGSNSYYYRSL